MPPACSCVSTPGVYTAAQLRARAASPIPTNSLVPAGSTDLGRAAVGKQLCGVGRRGKKWFWCFLLMPVVWEDSHIDHQPEEGTGCWRWLQDSIQDGAAHREGRSRAWERNSSQFMFLLFPHFLNAGLWLPVVTRSAPTPRSPG